MTEAVNCINNYELANVEHLKRRDQMGQIINNLMSVNLLNFLEIGHLVVIYLW